MVVFIGGGALAVSSSTSYRVTTEIMDSGSATGSTTSYRIIHKTRDQQAGATSSASLAFGAGFLKSAYFATSSPVLAPIVTSITPASGVNTGSIDITNLAGANFQSGATVKLSKSGAPDINATNVIVVSSSKITCTFNISGVAGGLWNVTVTNPDGRSGSLSSAFNITFAAPVIFSITPTKGVNTGIINITNLAGSNFLTGATVKLSKAGQSDIIASNVVIMSATQITCNLDLTGKAIGGWDISVTNTDGQSGSLSQGFVVESPDINVIGQVVSSQNPFNPSNGPTKIQYVLSKDATINLYVYNMRGERVWEYMAPAGTPGGQAGANEVVWDGLTAFKSFASFGVYIVMVTTTENGQVRTLSKTTIAVTK